MQEAVSGLQRSLQADKAKRDKIMAALAAQCQQDSEQQQSQQEEEDVQPQRTGKFGVTAGCIWTECAAWYQAAADQAGVGSSGSHNPAVLCVRLQLGLKHAVERSGCM